MNIIERLGVATLHRFDPERAHSLSLLALKSGLVPLPGTPVTSDRLRTTIAGLDLPNPVGLAAGFDKNATVLHPLTRAGFGFIEVGAATPKPQIGNPKPRLFRLTEDRAVINRFGFNNDGMEIIAARLSKRPENAIIGLNLGANKDSYDRADDFARVLSRCGGHLDFATVNVSSPNTENLRDLQGPEALTALLAGVMEAKNWLPRPIPIFLKIAPDLTESELSELAEEKGGLSGAPLFEKSTRVLAQLAHLTDGKIPLIGVGGIASAQDAYTKICAGASAVQLYSALVYQGLSLVPGIARGLDTLLERDGFTNVSQAVGTKTKDFL